MLKFLFLGIFIARNLCQLQLEHKFYRTKVTKERITSMHIYRPHSEGIGKVMFSQASVRSHLWEGGVVVPRPWSRWGGGYPIPGPDGRSPCPTSRWGGGTLSQIWMRGVPHPAELWGYPIQDQDSQDLMGVHPLSKTGWGTPPIQDWMGYLPIQDWMGYPRQQSEHLLRGGRCASCVHAGGLSCCTFVVNGITKSELFK